MTNFYNSLYTLWNQIVYALSSIRVFDVIDILVFAYIIYKVIGFAKETRAGQLLKGLLIVFVTYLISNWFSLPILRWILGIVVNSIFIVLIIVFQPELRRMLEKVGSSRIRPNQIFDNEYDSKSECIEIICKAAGSMQDARIGALIVFEHKSLLGEIINSGTVIDAAPSVSMVNNIFFPKSPLHDGAVIVRDDRLYAAGCILPLSHSNDISSSLGTRHRAAIGMSENSDAVVLVVSEETGSISIAVNGRITSDYSVASATLELKKILLEEDVKKKDKSIFGAIRNFFRSKNKNKLEKESEGESSDEQNK